VGYDFFILKGIFDNNKRLLFFLLLKKKTACDINEDVGGAVKLCYESNF